MLAVAIVLPSGTEAHGDDIAVMPHHRLAQRLARRRVPAPRGSVLARRGDRFAVRD